MRHILVYVGTMTLSACLIVRNEERFLDRCLSSLHGIVDEICIMDTGSTDGTKEIARAHGAILGTFEWNDDFSAARNACLDLAKGDWILQVDADEEVVAPAPAELDRVLRAQAVCHLVELELRGDDGRFERTWQPRLFRRDVRLRYQRALHETILDGLAEHHLPAPTKCNLLIVHHGYAGDVVASRGKIERNRRILRKVRDRGEADAYDLFKLASALEFGADPSLQEELTTTWKACLSSGWSTPASIRREWPWWPKACRAATTHLWSIGRLQDSRNAIGRLFQEAPEDTATRLALAHADLVSGRFSQAIERLRGVEQGARMRILCREASHDVPGALADLSQAEFVKPSLKARILIAAERHAEGVALLEGSFASLMGDADAGLDAAVALSMLGESATARNLLSRRVPGSAETLLERAAWLERLSGTERRRPPRDVREAAEDVLKGVLQGQAPEPLDPGFHLPAVRDALADQLEELLEKGNEPAVRRFASSSKPWESVLPGISRLIEGA